jgi:hypothetical protein
MLSHDSVSNTLPCATSQPLSETLKAQRLDEVQCSMLSAQMLKNVQRAVLKSSNAQ